MCFSDTWCQIVCVCVFCQQLLSLSPPAKPQPIITDSIWEEDASQQHFSRQHLQPKHLQSACQVSCSSAAVSGVISVQPGPDCLHHHHWPLFRLTHGRQTKLQGLCAASRDDSLGFRTRICGRKLIPYVSPCGSGTRFTCCCLEMREIVLGDENLDLKVESVVLLRLVPSYPLITNIFLVSFLIEKR